MKRLIRNDFMVYNPVLQEKIKVLAKVGIVIALFFLSFSDTLFSLVKVWWTRNDYSHGFLVPFITFYLIWIRRDRLKAITIKPNYIGGLCLMMIGSLLLILGKTGGILLIQGVALIVMIMGITLTFLGLEYIKSIFLPLLYLFLMLPILEVGSSETIHWPFQLLSAKMAFFVLMLLGIPVSNNVQYLELPTVSLEVAPECSGLNYLISIIAIAIPLAYLTQRDWRRKISLVVFAVIVGIMANWFRVVLIALWAYSGGSVVHGPWHIFKGIFVSIVGFIFLFIGSLVLNKNSSDRFNESHKKEIIKKDEVSVNIRKLSVGVVSAMLIFTGLVANIYINNIYIVPLNRPIQLLPFSLGAWKGEDVFYDSSFRLEGADSEINRTYKNAFGREIKLYIGYFGSQRHEKEIIQDNFLKFYNNVQKVKIDISPNNSVQVNKTLFRKKRDKYMVLFWTDINGKLVLNRYEAILATIIDGLIYHKTNGSVVIVYSVVNYPDELQRIIEDEKDFIKVLMPVLRNYLPLHANAELEGKT